DLARRGREEPLGHPKDELLLGAGDRVQRRLRAPQPAGEVVDADPREAFSEEDLGHRSQDLLVASVVDLAAPRRPEGRGAGSPGPAGHALRLLRTTSS